MEDSKQKNWIVNQGCSCSMKISCYYNGGILECQTDHVTALMWQLSELLWRLLKNHNCMVRGI